MKLTKKIIREQILLEIRKMINEEGDDSASNVEVLNVDRCDDPDKRVARVRFGENTLNFHVSWKDDSETYFLYLSLDDDGFGQALSHDQVSWQTHFWESGKEYSVDFSGGDTTVVRPSGPEMMAVYTDVESNDWAGPFTSEQPVQSILETLGYTGPDDQAFIDSTWYDDEAEDPVASLAEYFATFFDSAAPFLNTFNEISDRDIVAITRAVRERCDAGPGDVPEAPGDESYGETDSPSGELEGKEGDWQYIVSRTGNDNELGDLTSGTTWNSSNVLNITIEVVDGPNSIGSTFELRDIYNREGRNVYESHPLVLQVVEYLNSLEEWPPPLSPDEAEASDIELTELTLDAFLGRGSIDTAGTWTAGFENAPATDIVEYISDINSLHGETLVIGDAATLPRIFEEDDESKGGGEVIEILWNNLASAGVKVSIGSDSNIYVTS